MYYLHKEKMSLFFLERIISPYLKFSDIVFRIPLSSGIAWHPRLGFKRKAFCYNVIMFIIDLK